MRIGVLGAGQLGRMLALAGIPMGLKFRFFDPAPNGPASEIAEQIVAEYSDQDALRRFAEGCDVITYEFENVPEETAEFLNTLVPVYPPPKALHAAQDRLTEKRILQSLGIPTPLFDAVDSETELRETASRLGLPGVLKTRRFGYDGKGQFALKTEADLTPAWSALGGSPLIFEGFISFQRELSLIAVRSQNGDISYYPLVENQHREGILRKSIAPATTPLPGPHLPLSSGMVTLNVPDITSLSRAYMSRLMEALDYVGILTIEFFEMDGWLVANEMAPRVHNSGHWTIEGVVASQFENHVRAVAGLPLGSTNPIGLSAMLNCIGSMPGREEVLSIYGAHYHDYGKTARAGRKVGHITLQPRLDENLKRLEELIEMHA